MPWSNAAVPADTRELMDDVVDAAWVVFTVLGPGYLESIYHRCLAHELRLRGHLVETEVWLPVQFKGLHLDKAQRADVIVDRKILIELKAVEALAKVHQLQVVSYLKASGLDAGLLITFNVQYFREGFDRIVHPRLLSASREALIHQGEKR